MDDIKTLPIHRRIARQARDMHTRSGADVDVVISSLVDAAVADVPNAQYAGITVTRGRSHVRTEATTHRYPAVLDAIQQRHLEGPCLVAKWDHHTVRVPDLAAEARWPAYCRDALAATPIRAIVSFQLFTGRETMGTLNVYAEQANAFSPEAEEIGLVFATHAALAWRSVRREHEFASALASRDMIGQAKGIIMERYRVDALQAFGILTHLSQQSNVPVAEIARRLVAASLGEPNR